MAAFSGRRSCMLTAKAVAHRERADALRRELGSKLEAATLDSCWCVGEAGSKAVRVLSPMRCKRPPVALPRCCGSPRISMTMRLPSVPIAQ